MRSGIRARVQRTWGNALVAGPLMFPTILRWGPDGLYATNFSVGGNTNNGAIVHVTL